MRKRAISLIVLIITIIVLSILAGTVIVSLNGSGLISRAKEVVDVANISEIQNVANVLWSDAFISGARTKEELETAVINSLNQYDNLNLDKYAVIVNTEGVKVEFKNAENSVMTIAELQEKYEFEYYSTLANAVDDVNNAKIGENAGVSKADAVAGIFTYNNKNYIVLLKDISMDSKIAPSVDMIINLGGNTLSFTESLVGIDCYSGNIQIDGRLEGSCIKHDVDNGNTLQVRAGKLTVKGGTYTRNAQYINAFMYSMGELIVKDATIIVTVADTNGVTANVAIANVGGFAEVSNCNINVNNSAAYYAYGIQTSDEGKTVLSRCDIEIYSPDFPRGVYSFNGGEIEIFYCNIIATGDKEAEGIYNKSGTIELSYCDVEVSASDVAYGIVNKGEITATNCNIKAQANYSSDYSQTAIGVSTSGTSTINNCNITGVHSGVSVSDGTLQVNGGVYEGYGHGGFYFSNTNNTSYVRNATIRQCSMPNGYADNGGESNGSGFYIGGNADRDNITVYMDNCNVLGNSSPIVLRGTSGEQNNILYISNSTIDRKSVRIDNDTLKLYIGAGCNFTASNTNRASSVVHTTDVYIMD